MRFLLRYTASFFAVVIMGNGCGTEVAENVVARVGDVEITVEQLLQFRADTPALLRSEKEGVEELKDYLQTLIDIELMLLEARELGLEEDADFTRRWREEREGKLIFEFQLQKIMGQVNIAPDEMRERFAKSKWSRMVRLARIRVKTLAEAEAVVRELEAGKDFAELALERSLDRETAEKGGRLNYFLGRNELPERGFSLEIAEELFELEVGAFSRPFHWGSAYEIFQVVGQQPAPLSYAMIFARTRLAQDFYTLRRALLDSLARQYEIRFEPQGIALAIARLSTEPSKPLTASEQETVLCQLSDGRITLKDLYGVYEYNRTLKPGKIDSSTVVKSIHNHLLPGALFYRAALQSGIAQDSSVVTWLATKKREMLIEAVKERVVDRQIDLSDAAMRRYYRDHLDRFEHKGEVHLVEVLVETREEAEELMRRIEQGEDMEELAVRRSIRKDAHKNKGRLHMRAGKSGLYGELHTAAMRSGEGVLQGPVEIRSVAPGGYSIFKVVEKASSAPAPFAQVERRVRYWLRQEEEGRIMQAMFEGLRGKYAAQIEVSEERLQEITLGS